MYLESADQVKETYRHVISSSYITTGSLNFSDAVTKFPDQSFFEGHFICQIAVTQEVVFMTVVNVTEEQDNASATKPGDNQYGERRPGSSVHAGISL